MDSKEAREVMAKTMFEVAKSPALSETWEEWRYKDKIRAEIDAILAADPLRRLLGTKAVEALLVEKAAVVPLSHQAEDLITLTFGEDCREYLLTEVRLDTPGEAA